MIEYRENNTLHEQGKKNIALIFSVTIAVLTIILYAFWNRYQPVIGIENHGGWDGVDYRAVYNLFKYGTSDVMPSAPFSQRVFTPWFASLFNEDPINSFKITSLFFAVATNAIIAFISYRLAGLKGAVFILTPLLFHFLAPVRSSNFYPYINEPSLLFFESVLVLALYFRAYVLLAVLLPIAMLAKESFWIIGLAPVCWLLIKKIKFKSAFTTHENRLLFCLAVGSIAGLGVKLILPFIFTFIRPDSQFKTIIRYSVTRFADITSLTRVLAAILLTIAQYVFVLAWRSRVIRSIHLMTDERAAISVCWLLLHLFFAAFAGADSTRLFYLGYPLYVFILARIVRNYSPVSLFLSAFAGLYFGQILKRIPEPGSPIPHNDITGFFSWFPEYAHISVSLNILITIAVISCLFYIGRYFSPLKNI